MQTEVRFANVFYFRDFGFGLARSGTLNGVRSDGRAVLKDLTHNV